MSGIHIHNFVCSASFIHEFCPYFFGSNFLITFRSAHYSGQICLFTFVVAVVLQEVLCGCFHQEMQDFLGEILTVNHLLTLCF